MKIKKKIIAAILLLIFVSSLIYFISKGIDFPLTSIGGQEKIQSNTNSVTSEYWPTNEWRVSTPEEQGVDSGKLADMLDYAENFTGIRSVLIIRHGYLILEAYRSPYDKDTAMNVKSASKSIMSALTGIAIHEKYINSVDEKVADLLPDYFNESDSKKKDITLKHLLTMTSGLQSVEPLDDISKWVRSKDWVKHQLDLPLYSSPGEKFEYSTGLTHIMSSIITKTSGVSTLEFAKKYLFEPLGIKAVKWCQDPNGIYIGGAEVYLKPRDMAKFGYLYLHNGIWNDEQIIPQEWIESSVKNQVSNVPDHGSPLPEYGYWWWLGKDYYFAAGFGEQYIIVNPKLDMVVVFTAMDPDDTLRPLYENKICAAVKSNSSLKPNPKAFEKMNKNIDRLASPENDYATPTPELIEKINGKTFKCNKNDLGIDSFSLNFNDSDLIFSCKQVNPKGQEYTSKFPIGLNGKYKITPAEYHQTYLGADIDFYPNYESGDINAFKNIRTFFPINEPGGIDKFSVAYEGHWTNKNRFILKCLYPLGSPYSFLAVFDFRENQVNLNLSIAPLGIHSDIKAVMSSE